MRALAVMLGATVLVGCTTGAGSSPVPSQPPTSSPSPSAAFTLDVLPPEEPREVRTAIPGQGVAFLVVIGDEAGSPDPVTISVSATGATVRTIEPAEVARGTVGEVWVVPDPSAVETLAQVTITGTRGGISRSVERSLPVFPMPDERAADAKPHFDRWLGWLITDHPELGITEATTWSPEFVSTLLVVSHYAYWSDDWEITVSWHNMIPPYDWTEICLRHRWTEPAPSLAFRIESVSGGTDPVPVEPPEVVVR